ncbi:MAG: metallophosphoesterase [Planctomycetota bacterium]
MESTSTVEGASILWVTASSALIDAFVLDALIAFLARRSAVGSAQFGLPKLLVALCGWGLVFFVKAPLWAGLFEVSRFGVMRLLYVDLTIVIPVTAVAVLIWHWRGSGAPRCSRAVLVAAALGSLGAPAGYYATYVEPYRLQVDRAHVDLPPSRNGSKPVTIGVLADLQTDGVTDYEHRAVSTLLALEPDIILLPGDLFQGSIPALEKELPALRGLLSRLQAPGGVYFVQGNVDWTSHLNAVVGGTGVQLLVDETRDIEINGRTITLAGLGLHLHKSSRGKEVLSELEARPGADDIRIAFGHFPDWVLHLQKESRIDLFVAGHTHGGQVFVPLFGPPITLTRVPRDVAAGGLHDMDGRRIYVSRGVGMERGQAPRLRVFCPPCVSLLTIE